MHTKPPNLLCVASDEYEWGYEYRWEKELILMKVSPPSDWWRGGTKWNQSIIVERPHDWQAGPSLSAAYTVPPPGVCVCVCVCVCVYLCKCVWCKNTVASEAAADLCSVVVLAAFETFAQIRPQPPSLICPGTCAGSFGAVVNKT